MRDLLLAGAGWLGGWSSSFAFYHAQRHNRQIRKRIGRQRRLRERRG